MRLINSIWTDSRAATAAEFALVLPLLLIFLFGIIDVGRLMYTWNQAEKATQMGARFAAVTNIVAGDLTSHNFVGDTTTGGTKLAAGDVVPSDVFRHAECINGTCDRSKCSGSVCSNLTSNLGYNDAYFTNIVDQSALFYSGIGKDNIQIEYDNANMGYISDPNGNAISPLVTVKLKDLTFTPILFTIFGGSVSLPDFKATLTMEDGVGSRSN